MNKYIKNFLLLIILASLFGCSTPKFSTKLHDKSYKNKISSLNALIIRGNFPKAKQYLTRSRVEEIQWYKEVGEKIKLNFNHNGLNLTYDVFSNLKNAKSALNNRSTTIPTLVIHPYTVIVQSGTYNIALGFRATLFAPNREKPIWSGITGIAPYRAADELSLKILNELSQLKLVTLNKKTAETIEGKKNSSFGGVLTK